MCYNSLNKNGGNTMFKMKILSVVLVLFIVINSFTTSIVNVDATTKDEVVENVEVETHQKVENKSNENKSNENISIKMKAIWKDNQNVNRPDYLEIEIYRVGYQDILHQELGINDPEKLDEADFSYHVPKYINNVEQRYKVVVKDMPDYETVVTGDYINGYTIVNTLKSGTVDISVNTIFEDYVLPPNSINVHLVAKTSKKTEVVDTVTFSKDNSFKHTFKDQYEYVGDELIEYSLKVDDVVDYAVKINNHSLNKFTIDLKSTIDKITLSTQVIFNDFQNIANTRPNINGLNIFKQVKDKPKVSILHLSYRNHLKYSEVLPKYEDGELITYSVGVLDSKGYTITVETISENNFLITYDTPLDKQILPLEVSWANDLAVASKYRPKEIMVNIEAKDVNGEFITIANEKLTEKEQWKKQSKPLPKYRDNELIEYRLTADVKGYEGVSDESSVSPLKLQLNYLAEKIPLNVNFIWNDDNDKNKMRPEVVTAYAVGRVDDQVVSTVYNYFYDIDLIHELEKYALGKEIEYTIEFDKVKHYDQTITGNLVDGYKIESTYQDEKINKEVVVEWHDNNNNDGKRPTKINIKLFKKLNGTSVSTRKVNLSDSNNWKSEFLNLDKYFNHKLAVYEIDYVPVDGYRAELIEDQNKIMLNLYRENEKIDINVATIFSDNNNNDGKRPEEITVDLFSKVGSDNVMMHESIVVSADTNWEATFKDYKKYRNGSEIEYYPVIRDKKGYSYNFTGDALNGFEITLSYKDETINIPLKVNWNDNNNNDGKRLDAFELLLYEKIGDEKKVIESVFLTSSNGWQATFDNLRKYSNQTEVEYVIEHALVYYYTSVISANPAGGFDINLSRPDDKIDVRVETTWNDSDNNDGKRANSFNVRLYAKVGDEKKLVRTATLSKANDWELTFTDLSKYSKKVEVEYIVETDAIDEYTTKISKINNEFEIVHTHNLETVDINVNIEWLDADDNDGLRPQSLLVNLINETLDEIVETVTTYPDAEGNWTVTIPNVQKYLAQDLITYSINVEDVNGYTSVIENTQPYDYQISLNHEAETIEHTVNLDWLNDDSENRPESVTISLFNANDLDNPLQTVKHSGDALNNWSYTFTNLAKYHEKELINYVAKVERIKGYTTTYTYDNDATTITNTKDKMVVSDDVNTGMSNLTYVYTITIISLSLGLLLLTKLRFKRN